MQQIQMTPKQEKEREKRVKLERSKRFFTMFVATLSGNGIPSNDTRTVQAHPCGVEGQWSYYIQNAYLQSDTSSFDCVKESVEDGRYFYWGCVSGADNVDGILETNVPIGQILKSPVGNVLIQNVLKEEKISTVRNEYYNSIGEEIKPLKGHMTFFGKPTFPMGKILMSANGKFTYDTKPSLDVIEQLKENREKAQKDEQMRDSNDVFLNLGGGLVVPNQDTWIEQSPKDNRILCRGVNCVGLQYTFTPEAQLPKTNDGYFVQIGTVEVGRRTAGKTSEERILQFFNPYYFEDVVVWTKGKPLLELMHSRREGLNFALGEIFTDYSISEKIEQSIDPFVFAGGITIDSDGMCQKMEDVPQSVKRDTESYFRKRDGKFPTNFRIVNDSDLRDDL